MEKKLRSWNGIDHKVFELATNSLLPGKDSKFKAQINNDTYTANCKQVAENTLVTVVFKNNEKLGMTIYDTESQEEVFNSSKKVTQ